MPSLPSDNRRLVFIDITRTLAIFLALLSHSLLTTGVFEDLAGNALLIKQFTRFATPLFVFMFGFMMEFVYVRKARHASLVAINQRLLIRSVQCYLAYALTSLSGYVGGYLTTETFLQSLVFADDSRFGNILRTYSIILLLCPLLIKLRLRHGIHYLYAVLTLLVISYDVLPRFQRIDFGPFNAMANILMGIGLERGGPSVYGALSFFFAGMIAASSLSDHNSRQHDMSRFFLETMMLAGVFVLLALGLIDDEIHTLWRHFADMTYRTHNAPAYYIMGTLGCLILITCTCGLTRGSKIPTAIERLLPLGRSSLFSYTAGNLILNLSGTRLGGIHPTFFLPLFFLAVILLTTYQQKLPGYDRLNRLLNFQRAPESHTQGNSQ